ncbi:MAG: hypothetical protein EAX96_05255 [Candidatus Lokiarchaeota archaeon]|nr:hypothetical protein [Candidatus Lokiarchaeota archaeon]
MLNTIDIPIINPVKNFIRGKGGKRFSIKIAQDTNINPMESIFKNIRSSSSNFFFNSKNSTPFNLFFFLFSLFSFKLSKYMKKSLSFKDS